MNRLLDKLKKTEEIVRIAEELRGSKKVVGFTNGCFDLLHAGHVSYLCEAKSMVDVLVVGLNSDDSIRRIKGNKRPINDEISRAIVLCALESVDYVVLFGEDTPEKLIRLIRPDVLIKGADWADKPVAGCDFVKSYGGRCEFVKLVNGVSTTRIIERIRDVYC